MDTPIQGWCHGEDVLILTILARTAVVTTRLFGGDRSLVTLDAVFIDINAIHLRPMVLHERDYLVGMESSWLKMPASTTATPWRRWKSQNRPKAKAASEYPELR